MNRTTQHGTLTPQPTNHYERSAAISKQHNPFCTILTTLILFFAVPIAAFAACTNPAGSEGEIIYNSTAKMLQFCNGTLWINAAGVAPGAGGGGKPTYAGLTTATTYGNAPNKVDSTGKIYDKLSGMHAMCDAAFPGSRMMEIRDVKYVFRDIANASTAATYGWVHNDGNSSTYDYLASLTGGNNCGGSGNYSWTSYSNSYNGAVLSFQNNSGIQIISNPCGTVYAKPVHCVTD